MATTRKEDEWISLRESFHAMTRGESLSIEDIFDNEFRRRFGEVISRMAQCREQSRPTAKVIPFQK